MNIPLFDFEAAAELEKKAQHLAVELGRQPGMGNFETRLAMARRLVGIPVSKIIEHQERDSERNRKIGAKSRAVQSARRKGKPLRDRVDTGRDARLIAHHARLVAAGRSDATSETAAEFNLSTRRVRQILKKKDP